MAPIWSFDNPTIHVAPTAQSVKAALGWGDADVFGLPVGSSDIHKVIEQAHSRLVWAFHEWYYNNLTEYPFSVYTEQLGELFYNAPSVASQSVVLGDVYSLPSTYRKVIERGGGEIPKAYR